RRVGFTPPCPPSPPRPAAAGGVPGAHGRDPQGHAPRTAAGVRGRAARLRRAGGVPGPAATARRGAVPPRAVEQELDERRDSDPAARRRPHGAGAPPGPARLPLPGRGRPAAVRPRLRPRALGLARRVRLTLRAAFRQRT
ncbi:unnamed protein product, partial [Prorocentrum cordatum]